MLVYWLLFAFFAFGALITQPTPGPARRDGQYNAGYPAPFRPFFIAGAIATVCLVGLRYEVGGDWGSYLAIFNRIQGETLATSLKIGDPAYQLLNWIGATLGAGVWLVNLLSGAIFAWGLYRLCSVQPSPWLAFAVAVPYMVIVVAMGYTRQSIALGVLMAGLARQSRGGSTLNFALYVAAAACFHKTAAVVYPLVALSGKGSRFVNLLIAVFASILLYDLFLGDSMN
ncbi:MAG TPA: EpsG family protein, partial [Sphingomicrobium sp.]|nr:EpsG family protein [Sphingomicrobium sp.]